MDQTNELVALDFSEIDQDNRKSEDISTAVNSLTTELLAGETYDNEPPENAEMVEESNDINPAVVDCHDGLRADANCLTPSDVDTLNIETQQPVMPNTDTEAEILNSGDAAAAAEANPTSVPCHLEPITGQNVDVASSVVDVADLDIGVESERVTEVVSDCNDNQSQHLTSVLESPVSMISGQTNLPRTTKYSLRCRRIRGSIQSLSFKTCSRCRCHLSRSTSTLSSSLLLRITSSHRTIHNHTGCNRRSRF